MPLEDLDYMMENTEKDSVMVIVDSANRNKEAYPNSASYAVEFNEPIKNVFGIEILDASIPVTVYNIDKHNSTFGFTQLFFNTGYVSSDFLNYFNEMQDIQLFNDYFLDTRSTELFICNQESYGAQMFDALAADTTRDVPRNTPNLYMKRVVVQDSGIKLWDASLESALAQPNTYAFKYHISVYTVDASSELVPIMTSSDFSILADNSFVYYQLLKVTDDEAVTLVQSMLDPDTSCIDIYMNNNFVQMELGNYDSVSWILYLQHIFKGLSEGKLSSIVIKDRDTVSVTKVNNYGAFDLTLRFKFVYNGTNPFILDMKKSTSAEAIGFPRTVATPNSGYQILPHRTNQSLYFSKTVVNTRDPNNPLQQIIIAPYIINLTGMRYLLLRCPELENHLAGSFATDRSSPGLGMLRLGSSMDISNLRFDYVSLIKKPFHPIGKLSRLTLRFETKNGDLYDFKGVDHNVLLCIKYYIPKQKQKLEKSSLNPNYNSKYHEYVAPVPKAVKQIEEAPKHQVIKPLAPTTPIQPVITNPEPVKPSDNRKLVHAIWALFAFNLVIAIAFIIIIMRLQRRISISKLVKLL